MIMGSGTVVSGFAPYVVLSTLARCVCMVSVVACSTRCSNRNFLLQLASHGPQQEQLNIGFLFQTTHLEPLQGLIVQVDGHVLVENCRASLDQNLGSALQRFRDSLAHLHKEEILRIPVIQLALLNDPNVVFPRGVEGHFEHHLMILFS